MRAVILTLAAGTILLSGCTALENLDRRLQAALNPQEAPAQAPETLQPKPERKPTDVPPPKQPPARQAAPAAEAPKPEPAPEEETDAEAVEAPAPGPDAPMRGKLPDALVGISAEQLRARFGAPDAEIEETPGVTWRYRPQGCVLDIHLFPRVESQGLYALDVSSRNLPVDECLGVLTAPPGAAPEPGAGAVPDAGVGDGAAAPDAAVSAPPESSAVSAERPADAAPPAE